MIYVGNQSSYTFLRSMLTVEDILHQSKALGYQTVVLSDRNLHGLYTFFSYAKTLNLNAILSQTFTIQKTTYIISVLNKKGYQNLLKLNRIYLDELTLDDLIHHQDGLAFTYVIENIQSLNDPTFLDQCVVFHHYFFGINVMDIAFFEDEIKKVKDYVIPYYQPSYMDDVQKEALTLLQKASDIEIDQHYPFISLDALKSQWPSEFDAHETFLKLHEFELTFDTFGMPLIPLKEGVDENAYLVSLAKVGLDKRLKAYQNPDKKVYEKRLQYELSVILNMGFARYFLIVFDLIKYAKLNHILVGPGRGSASGSLVSYVLGITDVDPIVFNLLFERFLNPHRKTMPDIDMDFPDDKRDLVIEYAKQRFGIEHIASITTYQTYALKSTLRDITKAMGLSQERIAYITQSISDGKIDSQDRDMVKIHQFVEKVIGMPRQTGTHAAGIIFSDASLFDKIPLYQGVFSFYQSQWDQKTLESLGLLKMDFLGLRNLTIIAKALDKIKLNHKDFNLLQIPLDDQKTFEYLSLGRTQGIFQLESEGMRQTLLKLKPQHFEDIVVLLALYRPGPMEFIDTYIKRKQGEKYEVMHEAIAPILSQTYDIIIYQEQIMEIAQVFAGYTLAEADLLRRGVAKKNEAILKQEEENFISKAVSIGRKYEDAKTIYGIILKFSDYGFNRSHSVSYALLAYQMAYLKINYPEAFMVSLLDSVIGNESLTQAYLEELVTMGFIILSPNILTSKLQYQIEGKKILPPIQIIKSIGEKTAEHIVAALHGEKIETFDKLKEKLSTIISESQLENCIYAQSITMFDLNTHSLIENKSLKTAQYAKYVNHVVMQTYDEYPDMFLMEREKEVLGFNIKFQIKDYLNSFGFEKLDALKDKHDIECCGVITKVKKIKTKKGSDMAFITVFDGQSYVDVTMFQDMYEKYMQIKPSNYYVFKIEKNLFQSKESYVLKHIKPIEKN